MPNIMGIDGGGSNLRVTIVDTDMNSKSLAEAGAVNPSIVGFDESRRIIQETIRTALSQAKLSTVDAVGIGIAGAPETRSRDWLVNTIRAILPHSHIAPSSDDEISLVGALGERQGILILAGTGSIAYGINAHGTSLQVGGWGYLTGDKGSGYWLGLQGLQLLLEAVDAPDKTQSSIVRMLQERPELRDRHSIIRWLYDHQEYPVARIAKLAHVVLEAAKEGDKVALTIVTEGAIALVTLVDVLKQRLNMPDARIAFGGGLLSNDTLLCRELVKGLRLEERPIALYESVTGAALLARLDLELHNTKQSHPSSQIGL